MTLVAGMAVAGMGVCGTKFQLGVVYYDAKIDYCLSYLLLFINSLLFSLIQSPTKPSYPSISEIQNMSNTSSPSIPSITYSSDDAELAQFVPLLQENGFVRIDGVFSGAEMAELKAAMDSIVEGLDPEQHPRTTFNTSDEEKHVSDRYFLESVDKIRFFYEEGAVDKETGKLLVEKNRALNKVGHALHWLNLVFHKFTFHDRIKKIARLAGRVSPRVVQSMYIFKQPKIGGAANEHVDSTFLHTDLPNNLLGIWIAVDPARKDNGCLWFYPRSQNECLSTTQQYKFVRTEAANQKDGTGPLLKFNGKRFGFEDGHYVPVECETGSLVLIHGNVVHKSESNRSEQSRHAYTFHLVDFEGENGWKGTNWIQETDAYKFPALYES